MPACSTAASSAAHCSGCCAAHCSVVSSAQPLSPFRLRKHVPLEIEGRAVGQLHIERARVHDGQALPL